MSITTKEALLSINSENLTDVLKNLKTLYKAESVSEERKNYIASEIQKYGYLPMAHQQALEELSDAETMFAVEEKLKINKVYSNEKFIFSSENISPAARAGYKNSDWVKKEGHSLKLVNLAGLGNGNKSKEVGKFIDWLRQLVILPSGNLEKGILSTTMYLIPFHPREFGCAYLPKSSEVSEGLEDKLVKEKLDLNAKNQVRVFIALAQLAGHPVMYDVLPQTGRFSKTILSNTYVARWYDIPALTAKLNEEIEKISVKLAKKHNPIFVEKAKNVLEEELLGVYLPVSDDIKEIYEIFSKELLKEKEVFSNEMLTKEKQEEICARAKKVICGMLDKPVTSSLTEDDINNHGEIIGELIKEGLWPAPGGAWCSSGVPVFDKMSEGGGYPMFKHYDNTGKDVTHFANLDCQTPYYFVYFDKGEYNQKVIDFYINFLKKLQKDYNFDGFRVDHIDHIVDEVSEKDGFPISYRAPRKVLGESNSAMKQAVPHFATLAEYMLWDDFYKEYHMDMNFDLLWGNDIISQYLKNIPEIIKNNTQLEEYNKTLSTNDGKLSILKIYNNQDGEFREINQYPGQLGEEGALFKWFKYKFLPAGNLASRPVMYIDGDESFTKTGIEAVIGSEESMKRNNNYGFFKKFDAINRFAANSEIITSGQAQIINADKEKGFISWMVESNASKEKLFVIANEKPPTEVSRNDAGEVVNVENNAIYDIETYVSAKYSIASEYVIEDKNFVEKQEIKNLAGDKLVFDKLEPSEFHIYKLI